ncbi:MAG: hypothetical protein ACLGH8_13280 [Bacteroidia bacterium]
MTLPELIHYFTEGNTYEDFCKAQGLNKYAEIEIYMQRPFGINGKVEFFKIEETAGKVQHYYNGSEFYNLFDFSFFLNAVKEADSGDDFVNEIELSLKLIYHAERNNF